MDKEYKYFVSYTLSINGTFGTGNSEFIRDKKITGYKDIQEIKEVIGKDSEVEKVTIMNWKLFEK